MHALTNRTELVQAVVVACDTGMRAHAGCADACAACGARMRASIWLEGTAGWAAWIAGGALSDLSGSVLHAFYSLSIGLHTVQD